METQSKLCDCDTCLAQRRIYYKSPASQLDGWLASQRELDKLSELTEIVTNYSVQDFDSGYEQGYDKGREEAMKQIDSLYEDHRDCDSRCPNCEKDLMDYAENVCNH